MSPAYPNRTRPDRAILEVRTTGVVLLPAVDPAATALSSGQAGVASRWPSFMPNLVIMTGGAFNANATAFL